MAFPVYYELGRDVNNDEWKRKAIYHACSKDYVFKLVCEKEGVVVGHFNGFMYTNEPPRILTSGHIVGYAGASKYFACFYEGPNLANLAYRVELELVKAGQHLGTKQTSRGVTVNVFSPDAAVFKFAPGHSVQPVATPRPFAATAAVGDTAFIVGFEAIARDEPQLNFSEGVVSYSGLNALHTTARADDGYAGSPVFNGNGYIIGMVQGGEGTTKCVIVVPAPVLHMWLIMPPECPGFRG